MVNNQQQQYKHSNAATWILGASIIYGITIRLLYLLWMSDNSPFFSVPISDAAMYHSRALEISQGKIFSDEIFYQSPLFPYLLGTIYYLFDPNPWVIRVIHAAMGVANIALIFLIARFITKPVWAAVASLLSALYFGYVFHESFLLTETLGLHLLLWSLYFTLLANTKGRFYIWLIAGCFIGLTTLTRSNALLLLPLLSLWLVLNGQKNWKQYISHLGALIIGAAISITPATLHNWIIDNKFVLVTNNAGATFMFGNNPHARGTMVLPSGFTGNIRNQRHEEIAIAEKLTHQRLTHQEAADYWVKRSLRFLYDNPVFALRLEYYKFRRLIGNDEFGSNYISKYESNPYKQLMPLPYAIILGLSVLGMTRINWKSEAIQIFAIYASMTVATIMIFFMTARYRLPILPILIVFAAIGIQDLYTSIRRRQWFNTIFAVSLVGSICVISFLPIDHQDHQAAHWVREGVAWMRQDKLDLAEKRFVLAQNYNPDEQGLWLNSALLYYKQLNYSKALAAADRALTTEIGTDRLQALALKGVVLMALTRYDDAEPALSKAAKNLPFEPQIQLALIELYMATKRPNAARTQIIRAEAADVRVPERIEKALRALEHNITQEAINPASQ